MKFFVINAWIIPVLPLLAFLIILFGRSFKLYDNKKISMYSTVGSTAIGLLFSTFILVWAISHNNAVYQQNFTWIQAGNIKLPFGWLVDNLSAVMLMVVTSVSILIQVYSHEYMNHDGGYHKFFAYLALFNFSMLGLVLSTNLFQIYIFWELVGVSSYLLIGFWFKKPAAASAAKKAFIMNRIGDFGLLVGVVSVLYFGYDWWMSSHQSLLAFTSLNDAGIYILAHTDTVTYTLITFAIFLGAMAKSAQFPLHTWLPDAMEGPTPISALIHAATMVAAGVFLIARAYPLFELAPMTLYIMMVIGFITAFVTATIAIVQTDIKKILAYSTCSQLGFMVMGMGAGAYAAGLFHLVTHAYFKAMLFLCSGAVIHCLADQQDIRKMGGLRKDMPAVAYTYLIGTFAISGILLSGFWSKEGIFMGLEEGKYWMFLVLSLLVSGLTSFYMFRSYFLVFEGEYKGDAVPHKPDKVLTLPLIILAVPSVILGFALSGSLKGIGIGSFAEFVGFAGENHANLILPVISLIVSLTGFCAAAVLYWDRAKQYVSYDPAVIKNNFSSYYNFLQNKWYIDDFYSGFLRIIFLPLTKLFAWFDRMIIDGIVNLVGISVKFAGKILRLLQNGQLQTYTAVLFGGLFIYIIAVLAFWLL
ncbi:MAG: NADH-quinone oxidoreductase subunit L [Candidatus Gastranaerophilales bacterium]|nr:NADH-quinone oxidoreductase subunit L [Candidatus Gastranaerophilales bacterium]